MSSPALTPSLAAVGDLPYNIVRLIHLISVIVGTGLAFAAPVFAVRAARAEEGGEAAKRVLDEATAALMFPMMLIAGTAGGALVGMSDDFWDFSQTWLMLAGPIWMLVLVLVATIYPPSWLRLFTFSEGRKAMLGGLLHLSLAAMLVLMVWKWGANPGAY